MQAAWMVYAIAISILAGISAFALDSLAGIWRLPRRGVWMAALFASTAIPPALTARRANMARARVNGAAREISIADVATIARNPIRAAAFRAQGVYRWTERHDTMMRRGWIALSVTTASSFAVSMFGIARRRRTWRDGTVQAQRVLLAPDVGPAVVGFVRSRVVIPEWALALSPREQRFMLAHEREHIAARDPALLFGAGIVLVLFPWNIALWWMARRLRLAIEIDCDARVLRGAGESDEYGLFLIAVGERRAHRLLLTASLAERRSALERRIHAMTATRPRFPKLLSLALGLAAASAATLAAQTPIPAESRIASTSSPAAVSRFPLSNDELKLIIASRHPKVFDGTATDDFVTIVLDSAGAYVTSATSHIDPAQTAAVLREGPVDPGNPPPFRLAGIGTIDSKLVRSSRIQNFAAGAISMNLVRVHVVKLAGKLP